MPRPPLPDAQLKTRESTVMFSARLPAQLRRALSEHASRARVTASSIVAVALTEYLRKAAAR